MEFLPGTRIVIYFDFPHAIAVFNRTFISYRDLESFINPGGPAAVFSKGQRKSQRMIWRITVRQPYFSSRFFLSFAKTRSSFSFQALNMLNCLYQSLNLKC